MARKNDISLNDLVSDTNRPAWAERLRQEREYKANRQEMVNAYVNAILKASPDEDPEVIAGLARYVEATGSMDVPEEYNIQVRDSVKKRKEASPEVRAQNLGYESAADMPQMQAPAGGSTDAFGHRVPSANSRGLEAALADIRDEGKTQGWLGAAVDALQASGQLTVGNMLQALPRKVADIENSLASGELSSHIPGVRPLASRTVDLLRAAPGRASLERLVTDAGNNLRQRGEANTEAKEEKYKQLENSNWVVRNAGQGILDALESGASGAASLVGGPFGALPVADVYTREYNEALDKGLTPEDADAWAKSQALPEALAFIPAGKFAEVIPGVKRFLTSPLKRAIADRAAKRLAPSIVAAMTTAKAVVGEMGEEVAVESAADLAAMAIAGSQQGELQKLAASEAPKTLDEFLERKARAARAAAFMAGGITGPKSYIDAKRSDAIAVETDTNAFTESGIQGFLGEQQAADERLINDIRLEQERIAAEERAANPEPTIEELSRQREMEEEAAWNQRAKERQAEVQAETREGLRRSYVARVDTARQEVEALQERIENGEVDNATLNAASVANRNLADAEAALANLDRSFAPKQEEVEQAEVGPDVDPEALAREEQAKREQEALAPYNAVLLREMEAERKRKEKAEAKKTAEQKAAERKRQHEVARQLLAENPGKDITELAPLLRERLTAPQVTETNAIPEQQATASPTEQAPAAAQSAVSTAQVPNALAGNGNSRGLTGQQVLAEIASISDGMYQNHPSAIGALGGSFAGQGTLHIDEQGNVVLRRVAEDERHLGKGWTDSVSAQELRDTSEHSGSGRGLPTSGLQSMADNFGRNFHSRTVGTFRIPVDVLLQAIRDGRAYLGNLGEGEIVLSPDFARDYLSEIDGKRVKMDGSGSRPVATPSITPEAQQAPAPEVAEETAAQEVPVLTGDPKIDEQARRMGIFSLNMANPEVAANNESVDLESFAEKVRNIGRNLSKRNTRESVDTQNLVRTGKLILAPNAESVGRQPGDGAAEYDAATGKMYLYTDTLADGDDVGAMVAALHESTHAGQFNDRDGRDSVLQSIMGKERYDAAQARVRAIARKQIREGKQGPERAAVEAAEAAALANPDFNGDVEALEVMPYYVGEAARRQAERSGARTVAREIEGSARKFLRDKLGMDLEVTMRDIDYASRRVAGEIVNTELSPTEGSGDLAMVVGGRFTNDPRQRYKGAIDGLERYVISDAEAGVMAEYIPALQHGQMIPLGKLLNHPRLYELYPQLRDVRVVLDDDQKGYGAGVFNPNTGEIGLSEESVANLDSEEIRNTVLHETQHAVQHIEGFIGGENWERLMSPMYKADEQRDRQRRDRAINRFDLGRWKQTTTPTRLQEFNNEVAAKGIAGDTFAQSQLVLQNGWNADSTDRIVKRYGETVYNPARDALNTSLRALNAENKRAMDLYYSNYGEAEARTTEYASRMSQRELDNVSFEELFPEARNGVRVEDTLDTLGYGRGRTPDQSRSTSLEMEDTQTPEAKRDSSTANNDNVATRSSSVLQMAAQQSSPAAVKERKIPLWFRNLFDSTKGVDRRIAAMVEAASSSPAGDYMLAEQTVGKFEKALKALAVSRGTTFSKLNAQIESDLSKLTNQGSMAANKQAFNAVVSKYGEAGRQLMDLRDQIDGLSLDMWNVRAESGNPLTEAEKKSYKALLANLGYYTNRQFAALTGKAGKNYADRVWTDWERSKRPGKLGKEVLENAKKVSKAIKVIIDDSLRIPSNEDMAKMSADSVRRMYSTWVGPSDGRSLEEMKTALAEARSQIGEDRLNREAEDIAQELLGLRTASRPITEYYRGGKLDKGILQERKHMPEEIRELLGEITDPSMKMLLTVGKQAEFVARNKLLLDLTKQVGQDIQPPNATGTEAVKGMEVLKGDLWGPMEGYYVSPNMKALVSDMLQTVATFEQATALAATKPSVLNDKVVTEALGLWGRLAGRTKALTIIGNPMNYLWNYFGAYGSLMLNGNFSPKSVAAGHKAMKELIQYAGNSTKVGAEAMRMNKLGLTDSAFIGDIKSGQYKSLERLIKEMSGENISMTSARAKLSHLKTVGVETYAMMDVWAKMANFYQQVDFLTDFYKKNGDTKTAEEIDREAADIVNRTNITYKRAAPIVKALEKGGVTHYGTYFYEVFRTQVNNVRQGFDEYQRSRTAKTPEARNAMRLQAAKRVGGQLMFWSMAGYASSMLSALAFGDDEDEAQKLRKLLSDYLQDQDFIKVGTDANGQPVMMNISRVDPIGPATDFMRMMLNTEMTTEELGKKFLDMYVAPRLGGQLFNALAATFGDKRISRDPSIQEWMPTAYGEVLTVTDKIPGVDDNTTKGWTNVLEMFVLPGGTNALRETNPKVEDGTANEAFFGAMRFAGLTLAKLDPQKSARFTTMDYNDTLKSSRTTVANLFRDRPNVTQSEALSKITELASNEHKAYKKVSDVYQGMLAAGLSKAEAVAILKEEGLPVEAIRGIQNDTFSSQVISKKSIDSFAANEMKGKTLAQKREIKAKWDEVWETLSQVDEQMKEKN